MDIPAPSPSEFRWLLRQYRLSAGLTQEELAEKAGVSIRGLSDLERGARSMPRKATLERLAAALRLDGDDRHAFEAAAHKRLASTIPRISRKPGRPPVPLTSLVGREREVSAVHELLLQQDVRLVTLTGPGGVGKTRLALRVADTMQTAFEDGIVFVDLAPLEDAALLPSVIAETLGLRESEAGALPDRLISFLKKRHLLLILDNFERVTAAAPLVTTLLLSCPRLHVLITSRISLHVSGEHQFQVPPLQLPDPVSPSSLTDIAASEAVQLFITRASAVDPDFELGDANAAAVAAICQRLDGLPLGIELAAARIGHLPPASLLSRLDRRMELLTGGVQDQPARLQSMRDAVAWSHDLLSPAEQRLFRRMAVFVNGFTLDALVTVCDESDDAITTGVSAFDRSRFAMQQAVLDGIASLVDKSLLKLEGQADGEPRFSMLETIREFGLEQLEVSGEAETIRARHAAWCLEMAEVAESARIGRIPSIGIHEPGRERDNIRAALLWLRANGKTGTGLRLASALWTLWSEHGEITEGRAQLTACLAQPGASAYESAWAKAMGVLGVLAQAQGNQGEALTLSEQSLALFRRLGDLRGEAFALNTLGLVAMVEGNYELAETHLTESLALFSKEGDARAGFWSYRHLGSVAYFRGDMIQAAALAEEGLKLARMTGSKLDIAHLLHNLGVAIAGQSDMAQATTIWEQGLIFCRTEGDHRCVANILGSLGNAACEQGEPVQASAYLTESLALYHDIDDPVGTCWVLASLGWLAREQGDVVQATLMFEESLTLSRDRGGKLRVASSLLGMGVVSLDKHQLFQGAVLLEECLRLSIDLENTPIIASALEWLAQVAAMLGNAERATTLLAAANTLREIHRVPVGRSDRIGEERLITALKASAGEEAFAQRWTAGQQPNLDETIAVALTIVSDASDIEHPVVSPVPDIAPAASMHADALTLREDEILRLMAKGHTDREIAELLFLSRRTVNAHVAHVLAKLGASTRREAVTNAKANGMLPPD